MGEETYTVKLFCTNCYHSQPTDVKKGTERPRGAKCPNCGCETLGGKKNGKTTA